jgi:hypothetical protein
MVNSLVRIGSVRRARNRALGVALCSLAGPFLFLLGTGCRERPPALSTPLYRDSFDRADIGADWRVTASPGVYRIADGELAVRGAHNHPAWLVRELPRDAVIEVDVRSLSPDGDIKVEAWGDGKSYATELEYTSSGYVFIHGGWKNRISALCRLEEHGQDRQARQDLPVVPGKKYHYLIARKGRNVRWFIDGELALQIDDPAPLEGPSHSYFGFDDWETDLRFDNLTIRPNP